MLFVLLFVLPYFAQSIETQSEYFSKFEVKVKEENDEKPFKEAFSGFQFLLDHFAFYHNDVYFVAAPFHDIGNDMNQRILKELHTRGWNVTLKRVKYEGNEYRYMVNGPYYKVTSLYDDDDNPMNYRSVVKHRGSAWTVHELFAKGSYSTQGLCYYLIDFIGSTHCNVKHPYITVFKLDTRVKPIVYPHPDTSFVFYFIIMVLVAFLLFVFGAIVYIVLFTKSVEIEEKQEEKTCK